MITSRSYMGNVVYYREGTSDEKAIKEVLVDDTYRKNDIGFSVNHGEHWLDLGANIGAFGVYCLGRGASVHCYEPESQCFDILRMNMPGQHIVKSAITSSRDPFVNFFVREKSTNHWRGTIVSGQDGMKPYGQVCNIYAGCLVGQYDGVKMDIEGSEFGIIDNGIIPRCQKLVFEYHTSRDPSMQNLARRLERLRCVFNVVEYPDVLDDLMEMGGNQRPDVDQLIFCMHPRA